MPAGLPRRAAEAVKIIPHPRFEIAGRKRRRVYLLCSQCGRRLPPPGARQVRPIAKTAEVDASRAYFCRRHDPGFRIDNSAVPIDTDRDFGPEPENYDEQETT